MGQAPWSGDLGKGVHSGTQARWASRVRLHDLRHFTVTLLPVAEARASVRTVIGWFGHPNAATTLGAYAGFMTESDQDAAAVAAARKAKSRAKADSG